MTDIGIGSWPARRARMEPNAVAFRQADRSFTYAQIAGRVQALAAGFAALGVVRGDRIAYLGPNDIATFETLFAAGRLGATFVPLNTRLSGLEIAYMLADSNSRVLVYGPESADLVLAADPAGVEHVIALDPATAPGGVDYADLLATTSAPPVVDVGLDDDALILYTSGTTGRPKGAVLTHGNITFNTVNQLAQVDVLGRDVVVCTAPLFHVVGLGQVTLPALFKGGTVIVAPKFDAAWLLDAITRQRVNAFSAVPTMLQMMCDHPDFATADLTSLRYIVYGGSPVLARVAKTWLDRGVPLLQGYGMTEAGPGVSLAMPGGVAPREVSAGVPQFYVDLALQTSSGEVTAPRGAGELLIKGPNVFRGYLNRPLDTDTALAGGWFHTGDVVRIDDDGWAYIVDRTKDMIISGGENIYPAEVEAAIAEMPEVADCAVIGVPDERWGEVGLAVIVPRVGLQVGPEAVLAHLHGRLARYKIPKYFQLSDELPRTATGKVRKDHLRAAAEPSNPQPAGRREPSADRREKEHQ